MKKEFKIMSESDKWNTYGGFSPTTMAMIPLVIQAVATAISSIKMMTSHNGSFNYNGMKSDWSTNKESASKETKTVHETYYSF